MGSRPRGFESHTLRQKSSHHQVGTFLADTQDSNPRALGHVPGARFNPRRPAPQRRSNPILSAKKCSHRQVGTFFADAQDSNPRARIKQKSLTPALLYLCTENILPGGVLNSSRHRAFGARYFVSQMTLRTVCVSPPASIPKQVLPNVPLFVPKPGSRYSDVGSGVSQFRKRLANTHGGYLNNRSGSRPPNK